MKVSPKRPVRTKTTKKYLAISAIIIFPMITAIISCKKHDVNFPQPQYLQVNLVADTAGFGAALIDKNLVNAWGIALNPNGIFWISANHTALSTVYDKNGNTLIPPVSIPSSDPHNMGAPTGAVFNNTADFIIPANMQKAKFIFAGEDGIISAWSSGNAALVAADRSAFDAVYKGLALAADSGQNFLYAADFKGGKIDVFDKNFNLVSGKPFKDPNIPAGFAPFNIQYANGWLYVTYAKQKGPDNEDDESGPGNGFVDIYKTDGSLVSRFASRGVLNSPWGMAWVPDGFGLPAGTLLIGNFGDGRINEYDTYGHFLGQLKDTNKKPISIEGLWALTFPDGAASIDPDLLYFTAGPDDESHGLFGYIKK